MAHRIVALGCVLLLTTVAAVVGAAAAYADCDERFPEHAWVVAGETDLLRVSSVGISESQGMRWADMANGTAQRLLDDLGEVPTLDLCLFGPDVRLDPTGLAPPGQLLHAAVFAEEGTVYVGGLQARLYDESHAFGLAYAALWDVAARQGLEGYPEPLATVIGQWYMSRAADKLDLHHNQMRGGAFFRDPSGGGVDATPWTASTQSPIYTWNPQFQESPVGDLVGFAVATHGAAVLRDPDGARWASIEQAWQTALRDEALAGGGGSGNAWLVGLGIVIGSVALAILLAWGNRRSKRKIRERARLQAES